MSDINPSVASAAQNPPAFARLEAGLTAPDFTLPSDNGGSVTLSALRGQNIILYFYPAAMTPGCTTEACDFRDNLARLSSRGFHSARRFEGSAGQAYPIPRARSFDVPPVVGC